MLSNACLPVFVCFLIASASATDIIKIPTSDGEQITGRLCIPDEGYRGTLVIDVPSSGPHTYLDHRKVGHSVVFNYHDLFADEFNRRGLAYFSYSTRYTEPDTMPPYFDRVDMEKFVTYTPSTKIEDLEVVIKNLVQYERLKGCKVILLGQSEGSILASVVAERGNAPVDALLLCGTPTDDVYTTIEWQFSGEASMINMRKFFDTNEDSVIQMSEYLGGDPRALRRMEGASFESLDMNGDSTLTVEDFRIRLEPSLEAVMNAVDEDDDEWLWNNFFRVGAAWIKEHRDIEPNRERILKLNLPVYIFHGEDDANCSVSGIWTLKKTAEAQGKDNIHIFTFPEHDHSLEFLTWVIAKQLPEGLQKVFETAEALQAQVE